MYNREQMKEALGKLNWPAVTKFLNSTQEPPNELAEVLVEDVIRTGCLILKRGNEALAGKRNQFCDSLKCYVAERGRIETVENLNIHLEEVRSLDEAYHQILSSLAECAISSHALDIQIWGVIDRAIEELRLIFDNFHNFQTKRTKEA